MHSTFCRSGVEVSSPIYRLPLPSIFGPCGVTNGCERIWPISAIFTNMCMPLKGCKHTTEFSADDDWIFACPAKLGRLQYSYTGVWRELGRASEAASLGHIGTHTFRHSCRMWIDAIGTRIGVQQKLMRHSHIRTTMNIYGDRGHGGHA